MRNSILLVVALSVVAQASETLDVVFLAEQKPVILRLNVQVDGKTLPKNWSEYVDGLFKRLDANSDNHLSLAEARGIPETTELARSGMIDLPDEPIESADLDDNGKVTKSELMRYFESLGARGFSHRTVKRPGSNVPTVIDRQTGQPISSGFFGFVDRNRDGRLDSKELLQAYSALQKFDRNDDEYVGFEELGMAINARDVQRIQPPESAKPRRSFIVMNHVKPTEVASEVITQYDTDDNRQLSPQECGLEKKEFQKIDGDGDGQLQLSEIEAWLQTSPGEPLEMELFSDRKGRIAGSASAITDREQPDLLVMRFKKSQVDLTVVQRSASQETAQVKRQFVAADRDKNGYLTLEETRRFRNFRHIFAIMDRDNDDKVFEAEMKAFADGQLALADAHVTMVVTEQGRDLAEILDVNRDSRLSRRELVGAQERLKSWDRDRDGKISAAEIPRQFSLAISRSQPELFVQTNRLPVRAAESPGPAGKIPIWFRNMDRNNDSELSRREFLGTTKVFRQFDKNGDGLISPAESRAK